MSLRIWRLVAFSMATFAVGVFALYVALAPCFQYDLIEKLSVHPEKLPTGSPLKVVIGGQTFESSFFSVYKKSAHKKIALSGVYVPAPNAKDLVLISHGNGGTIPALMLNYRIAGLHKRGYAIFAYDYAGYGQSEGKACYDGLLEDGLAAFNHCVKDLGFASDHIILYGLSMGGGVTGEIARQFKTKAVILDGTYVSPEYYGKQMAAVLRIYPSILFPWPHYDNLAFVKSLHAPLLIVHGRIDKMIPCEQAKILRANAGAHTSLVMLEHSAHCCMEDADKASYDLALDQFLKQLNNG